MTLWWNRYIFHRIFYFKFLHFCKEMHVTVLYVVGVCTFINSYLYVQQSARYLEHLYLVLTKYSRIRLQVSCCCNHQVYIIYDLKITKIYTIFYQYKNILSCVCQKQFKFHFIFLSNNLFWCLQPLINSFLLFNRRLSSIKSMIYNFSRRHNLQ